MKLYKDEQFVDYKFAMDGKVFNRLNNLYELGSINKSV